MPRQSGLLCRKGRFYLNMRVPKELRPLYGKKETIRKSLNTASYMEAARLVRFESFRQEAEFEERRQELKAKKAASERQKIRLLEINDKDAHMMVFRWFVEQEKLSQEWWENDGIHLKHDEFDDALDILRLDETGYTGGNATMDGATGATELERFLKKEEVVCPKESLAYKKLQPLFRKARLENIRRSIEQMTRQPVKHEPLFAKVFAHTELQPMARPMTLGELLAQFQKWLVDAKRADTTRGTYKIPSRILSEVFGKDAPLASITREKMEELFRLLTKLPVNAAQRYPGRTMEQAVREAEKRKDTNRLKGKTLQNYFDNLSAIFNFAVEKQYIASNPAKDRYLRSVIAADIDDEDARPKALFSIAELNRFFKAHAPLHRPNALKCN